MKVLAVRKRDQNDAALDPWTAVHFGAGMAMGLLGVRFGPAIALALGYEIAEQVAERNEWGSRFFKTSGPESAANVVCDTAIYAVAWWLGRRYNEGV